MAKRRIFLTADMKRKALFEAKRDGVGAVATRYNISAASIHRWRKQGIKPAAPRNGSNAEPGDALVVLLQLVRDRRLEVHAAAKVIERLR